MRPAWKFSPPPAPWTKSSGSPRGSSGCWSRATQPRAAGPCARRDRRRLSPSPQEPAAWWGKSSATLAFPWRWNSASRWTAARQSSRWPALLRLDADDWPLGRCWPSWEATIFAPIGPSGKAASPAGRSEQAIRRLQIPRGRRVLLDRLGREIRPIAAALLRRLAAALDELPERASLAEWGDAWRRLARQTGLLAATIPRRSACCPSARAIAEAWRRSATVAARETISGAMARPRGPGAGSPRRRWRPCWTSAASRRLKPDGDDGGRVRVLSAANARALRMPYVFLAGLSEKSFPSPEREDRLYGHAEAQRLVERGLPLVTRSQRSSEEMLLFYEAATRATRRLWLTYPAMDESAQRALAQPLFAGSRAGVRGGANRADRAERLESRAGRRRAALARRSFASGRRPWPWRGTSRSWPACLQRPLPAHDAGRQASVAGLLHVALRQDPRAVWPGRGNAFQRGDCVLGGRFPRGANLQRHRVGAIRRLPLPLFPGESAPRRAAGGVGPGNRFPGAGTVGARGHGGVPSAGQSSPRRARLADRAER